MTQTIRILLVDDHRILRNGLKALLANESDIEIVGEADNGTDAVQLVRQHFPDVVVMDVQLPGIPAAEAIRSMRQIHPGLEVLILTMHDSSFYAVNMLKAGARSYLLKESAGTDFANALRATKRGNSVLDPAVARCVVDLLYENKITPESDDELTPRELQIFELIAVGQTSREIAQTLGLSAKTIDNCRAHILQKLQARNRVEAIAAGVRRGLLPSGISA
jgi:DNA-binding NarL/FixJ family response regulator